MQLSVFEVTAEKDLGYAASSALTGTRTSEKLADLPNSISVMTQEFLQDIAVTVSSKTDSSVASLAFHVCADRVPAFRRSVYLAASLDDHSTKSIFLNTSSSATWLAK